MIILHMLVRRRREKVTVGLYIGVCWDGRAVVTRKPKVMSYKVARK